MLAALHALRRAAAPRWARGLVAPLAAEARDPRFASVDETDLAFFRHTLGDAGVVTNAHTLAQLNTDWMGRYVGRSRLALQPASTKEVSAVLAHCFERRLAVTPQAGNTSLSGGSVPVRDEILFLTKQLDKVIEIDDDSGVVTCQAGVTLANLDAALAPHGLCVPLDLAAKARCQIGGNVSTNAGGLRLLRFGSLHGSVVGLEVVLPDGNVLDLLKAVRKDNTGLHLRSLFIGAEGTLGVVTAVSLLGTIFGFFLLSLCLIVCSLLVQPRPALLPCTPPSWRCRPSATCSQRRASRAESSAKPSTRWSSLMPRRCATWCAHVVFLGGITFPNFTPPSKINSSNTSPTRRTRFRAWTPPRPSTWSSKRRARWRRTTARSWTRFWLRSRRRARRGTTLRPPSWPASLPAAPRTRRPCGGCGRASPNRLSKRGPCIRSVKPVVPFTSFSLFFSCQYDLSLPTSRMYSLVEAVKKRVEAPGSDVRVLAYGHVGDGNLHLNVSSPHGYDRTVEAALEPFVFEQTRAVNGSVRCVSTDLRTFVHW